MTSKKLYIKTYGCQMNFYDSGRMRDVMHPHGFENTEEVAGSHLVILNTCHIREKASEKLYSELGRIREEKERMKQDGERMVIAVAGCVAQAEGEEIRKRAPYVDIVVGPQAFQRLPELVANYYCHSERAKRVEESHDKAGDPSTAGVPPSAQDDNRVVLDFATVEKFDRLPEESAPQGASAFLTIQEGCDKFCTYCVVPYTRGAEFSRPVAEVIREALKLVGQGAQEITLLGQNVNAYHGKPGEGIVAAMPSPQPSPARGRGSKTWNFARLIRQLAEIPGLQRIRYTTSYPSEMDDAIIAAHAEVDKLMPFIHLPVQSGSDKVLKEMNRRHTAQEYLDLVAKFRAARPDIQFSSDFIVGFPGETEQDFEDTLKLVEAVGYAQCYSFKYSARPGTPAATREDTVPEAVKDERLQRLQALINKQQQAFNDSCIGKVVPVLLDRKGRHPGQAVGRSPYMQSVHVDMAAHLLGQIVDVKLVSGGANGMKGMLCHPERAQRAEGSQVADSIGRSFDSGLRPPLRMTH